MDLKDTVEFLAQTSSSTFLDDSSSSASSSSSSSDDENFYRAKRVKIENFIEDTVQKYSHEEFRSHFRMNRSSVAPLINMDFQNNIGFLFNVFLFVGEVSQLMSKDSSGWPKITAEKAFLLLLWYLANKESFRQISDRFDITMSCAHNIIKKLTNHFVSISDEYIKWPNENEKRQIAQKFEQKKGLQKIIGALDGSHIAINRPKEYHEDYYNRKRYYSILIQAVVDSDLKFLNIYAGEPGSLHDARMLRRSELYSKAEQENLLEGYCLLGDSAYPSLRWLVPPFRDNGYLSENQKLFNFIHSSTRIVVENAFGILKGRFRRLQHFDNKNKDYIVKCIITACIFHNICLMENDNGNDMDIADIDENDNPEVEVFDNNDDRRNQLFRDMFPN